MLTIIIEPATYEELAEILSLQKLCYQKEGKRYNDFTIPPLTQTIEEIQAEFTSTLFLKAQLNGRIIGSIKGKVHQNTCDLGRLMVHPDFQRQGIAKQLINRLEIMIQAQFLVERFELFTGELSFDNIALYQSQGYRIFKTEQFEPNKETKVVYMEKWVKSQ